MSFASFNIVALMAGTMRSANQACGWLVGVAMRMWSFSLSPAAVDGVNIETCVSACVCAYLRYHLFTEWIVCACMCVSM